MRYIRYIQTSCLILLFNFLIGCTSNNEVNIDGINKIVQEQYQVSSHEVNVKGDTLLIELRVNFGDIANANKMKILRTMIIYDSYEYLEKYSYVLYLISAKEDSKLNEVFIYNKDETKKLHDAYLTNKYAVKFNRYILNKISNKELHNYDVVLNAIYMYKGDEIKDKYDFIDTVLHYSDDLSDGKKDSKYLSLIKGIKIVMKDNELVPKDVSVAKLDFFIQANEPGFNLEDTDKTLHKIS